MKRNGLLLAGILGITTGIVSCTSPEGKNTSANRASQANTSQTAATPPPAKEKVAKDGHDHSKTRVPAFQKADASLKNLGPTLSPESFIGKTRDAYKAVREIPQTIAQLPCYCYCDEAHGHKSLYSCFEDNHASQCAVCVDEALIAYHLEKQQKLKPEQIRERIVAQYSH